MLDDETAEVGLVGRVGMTGLSIALGQSAAQQPAIIQVPGEAQCLAVTDLRNALESQPELTAAALRYAQATINTSTCLSACNELDATNERCARWLLMAYDRVNDDVILPTQEFLSQMFGVQRTGVNVAAAHCERSASFPSLAVTSPLVSVAAWNRPRASATTTSPSIAKRDGVFQKEDKLALRTSH
jgi:hypothetical protein